MSGLAGLARYQPLDIRFSQSLTDAVEESAYYFTRRIGRGVSGGADRYRRRARLVAAEARGADVVLCHRRFPLEVKQPVVWQHAVLDPRMRIAAGASEDQIARDYADQAAVYEAAAAVQVSTQAEADRHRAMFPSLGDRFKAVPFFLPHIQPLSDADVRDKHRADEEIRVLFVGREARRKGLDLVLEGFAALPPGLASRVRLDIVSNLSDGPVTIPASASIERHPALSRDEVLGLMKRAHIFIMPSRFESYGFTFIEAMANGCAVVGPRWEVQSEILGDGQAGLCVSDGAAVAAALEGLCGDPKARAVMAMAGLRKYHDEYSPRAVAGKYFEVIVGSKV